MNHPSDIEFKDLIKLDKNFTEKLISFLVNDTNLLSDNPLKLRITYFKIAASEKVKTIYNKQKLNKV